MQPNCNTYSYSDLVHELGLVFRSVRFKDVRLKKQLYASYLMNLPDLIAYARDNGIDVRQYIREIQSLLLQMPRTRCCFRLYTPESLRFALNSFRCHNEQSQMLLDSYLLSAQPIILYAEEHDKDAALYIMSAVNGGARQR